MSPEEEIFYWAIPRKFDQFGFLHKRRDFLVLVSIILLDAILRVKAKLGSIGSIGG